MKYIEEKMENSYKSPDTKRENQLALFSKEDIKGERF